MCPDRVRGPDFTRKFRFFFPSKTCPVPGVHPISRRAGREGRGEGDFRPRARAASGRVPSQSRCNRTGQERVEQEKGGTSIGKSHRDPERAERPCPGAPGLDLRLAEEPWTLGQPLILPHLSRWESPRLVNSFSPRRSRDGSERVAGPINPGTKCNLKTNHSLHLDAVPRCSAGRDSNRNPTSFVFQEESPSDHLPSRSHVTGGENHGRSARRTYATDWRAMHRCPTRGANA